MIRYTVHREYNSDLQRTYIEQVLGYTSLVRFGDIVSEPMIVCIVRVTSILSRSPTRGDIQYPIRLGCTSTLNVMFQLRLHQ